MPWAWVVVSCDTIRNKDLVVPGSKHTVPKSLEVALSDKRIGGVFYSNAVTPGGPQHEYIHDF